MSTSSTHNCFASPRCFYKNGSSAGYSTIILSLALGTPMSLVGAIGAALSLGARRGGPNFLLILPLLIPVLVFGVSAVETA